MLYYKRNMLHIWGDFMDLNTLAARFSDTRENRQKAIFSTLFIAGNRLQTLFDKTIPELSLKQFMLLSVARQSEELFIKTLKAKKDQTEEEREMVRMISSSYDISDKKYIEPILNCLGPA